MNCIWRVKLKKNLFFLNTIQKNPIYFSFYNKYIYRYRVQTFLVLEVKVNLTRIESIPIVPTYDICERVKDMKADVVVIIVQHSIQFMLCSVKNILFSLEIDFFYPDAFVANDYLTLAHNKMLWVEKGCQASSWLKASLQDPDTYYCVCFCIICSRCKYRHRICKVYTVTERKVTVVYLY